MKKLHNANKHTLVTMEINTCAFCKEQQKEIIIPTGYTIGLCHECAKEVVLLFKREGLIPGQVAISKNEDQEADDYERPF